MEQWSLRHLSVLLFCLLRDLNHKAKQVKNHKAKIELLGSYDPQKQLIIQDPYYVSIQAVYFVFL